MARIRSTAKMTTPTSSEAAQRDKDAPDTVKMRAIMPISEAMKATAEMEVTEEEDVLEENISEVEEVDNDLWLTKPSYIDIGESTVEPNDFDVMKKLGYVDEKDGVHIASSETTLQPKNDKIIVFRSLF
jgi:hypothetical protein